MALRLRPPRVIDGVEEVAVRVRIGDDRAGLAVERGAAGTPAVADDRRGDLMPRPPVVGRLLYMREAAVPGVVVRDPGRGPVVRDPRPVGVRLIEDRVRATGRVGRVRAARHVDAELRPAE